MVEFYAGSEHVAHVRLVNPTQWDWEYAATLKINGAAVSSETVSVPAGGYGDVDIPVRMPSQPGTLAVSVSITETLTGEDLGTINLDTVEVVAVPVPEVTVTMSWD